MSGRRRLALLASPTPAAQAAAAELHRHYDFVDPSYADVVVALGGDGFLLQTLHAMLAKRPTLPVFGMNQGTIGFLMKWDPLESTCRHASLSIL